MKKIVSALVALVLVLAGCGASSDTFVYSVASPVESLDPLNSSYKQTFDLFSDIFVGAQKIDGEGNLSDGGSTAVEISDDGLVYTISLRDDAVWVDNTGAEMGSVTANDYVTAYQRMVDPVNASVYAYIYEPIKNATAIGAGEKEASELGVKAIDDYTLEITLEQATPYFKSMLAFESFAPVATGAIEDYGSDYGTSAETTWYNGAYYVTDYDTDSVISLSKNNSYFGADHVEVENIDFRLNEDSTSRYNAFLNGELDYAEIASSEDYTDAKEQGIINDQLTGYSFYGLFNHDDSAATSNENLRKALLYGFDREQLVTAAYGEINKAIEYFIPSDMTPAAYDGVEYRDYANDSLITYDKAKADEYFDAYMKDMGYSSRDEISFRFLASADTNGGNKVAEAVQAFYKQEFGINVELIIQPFEQFVESRRSGAFDLLVTGWGPDYADPSTYLALFQTSQIGAQNYASYSSEDYDKLYLEANSEQDPEKRFTEFSEIEQMLVDDQVIVPFYQKNAPYVVSDGYNIPLHLFFHISHEYITTN